METNQDIFFTWVGNSLNIPYKLNGFYIYKTENDIWDSGLKSSVTNVYLEYDSDPENVFDKIRIFLSQIGALWYLKGQGDYEEGPVNDDYYKALISNTKRKITKDPEFYTKRV